MKKKREKILSLTAKDFEGDYYRGSGTGGQKKNKTESACRCRHLPSGALGACEDSRIQKENRQEAFKRMTETSEFKAWLQLQIDEKLGLLKTEVFEKGKWVDKTGRKLED